MEVQVLARATAMVHREEAQPTKHSPLMLHLIVLVQHNIFDNFLNKRFFNVDD